MLQSLSSAGQGVCLSLCRKHLTLSLNLALHSQDYFNIFAQKLFPDSPAQIWPLPLVPITLCVVPPNSLLPRLLLRGYRLRAHTSELQSQSHHRLATELWASYLYSLSLAFLFV